MNNNNLVRVSNTCAIQFLDITKRSIFESDIYCLLYDDKIQLLTDDVGLNRRDWSYAPYMDNILLRKTPYPWITDEVMNSVKLSKHVGANIPDIEYQKVLVNYAAGFNYAKNDYATFTRLYYIIDDKYEITVSAIVDYKSGSRFVPNAVNIVLDSVIFNTSVETEILNIPQLFQSNNTEMIKLKETLFGTNTKSCSELFIEQAIIENSQIMEFIADNKPYNKFFIEDLNKSYWNRTLDLGEELYVNIEPRSNTFDSHIAIKLDHTKFNIEAYLKNKLFETDTWDIKYEITQTAYNINDEVISSISQYAGNFNNPYTEILYKPLISDDWYNDNGVLIATYCVLDVRCIARTSVSNIEIQRQAMHIISDLLSYFIKPIKVDVPGNKIYSRKEIINHEVSMKSDLPNIIKIIKPHFVFTQASDKILLTPYKSTIGIPYEVPTNINSSKIIMRFDEREYECQGYDKGSLMFNIPGSEYMNKTKVFYLIFDNEVLSHGQIERIK